MILAIECAVLCALFTVIVICGKLKNPLSGLHNLPTDIQQRVHELPEYTGKTGEIMSTKQRIIKKLPALVIAASLFGGLVYLAGARDFFSGFACSLVLWTVIKLYVTLVLNCGWFAHCKKAWIPGTQDMQSSYQDYGFYLKSIPRSLLFGAIVSAAIGIFIEIIK